MRLLLSLFSALALACGSSEPEAQSPTRAPVVDERPQLRDDSPAAHFELLCTLATRAMAKEGPAVDRAASVDAELTPQITHEGFGHAWSVISSVGPRARALMVEEAAGELEVEWACPESTALWQALADEIEPIEPDGPWRFTGVAREDELAHASMLEYLESARELRSRSERVYPQPCGFLLMNASGVSVERQVDPRVIASVDAARAYCRDALAELMRATANDPRLCLMDAMAENVVNTEGWNEQLREELQVLRASCPR